MTAEVEALKQATPIGLLPICGERDHAYWKGGKAGEFTLKSSMKLFKLMSRRWNGISWFGVKNIFLGSHLLCG